MSIFPNLSLEKEVQIDDRTRFNATKSFISGSVSNIAAIEIRPGDDSTLVDVFDPDDKDDWYLDWQFVDFKADIDSSNNQLLFSESDGQKIAVLTPGTYTLIDLVTEVEIQMNASGNNVYLVNLDSKNKISVSADGNFSIIPKKNNVWSYLGFERSFQRGLENSKSYRGSFVKSLPRFITVTVTDDVAAFSTRKFLIDLFSVEGDMLFSNDGDLLPLEPKILEKVPKDTGRISWLNVHREAQRIIMSWLDEKGYVNTYGDKFKPEDLQGSDEFNEWSKYEALEIIFNLTSNVPDDTFAVKASEYNGKKIQRRSRAIIRIDVNNDQKVDVFEQISKQSSEVIRR